MMQLWKRRLHVPVVAALAVAGSSPCILAETLHVPGDYPTVQDAINAAVDGDEVLIQPGNYAGRIDFLGKAIIVKGAGDDASDVGVSTTGDSIVNFVSGEGRDSVLENLSIREGRGSDRGGFNVGGGMRIENSAPTIRNCFFINCIVTDFGGGVYCAAGSPRFIGTAFFTCLSNAGRGGAIFADEASDISVENCIFLNGNAVVGGSIYLDLASTAHVLNTTMSINFAHEFGAGIAVGDNSFALIENSIIFDNEDSGGSGKTAQLFIDQPTGSAKVNYTCIQAGWDDPGTNNISLDPRFNNFDLADGSPCIDAGNNTVVPVDLTVDYAGDPRFVDDPGTRDVGNGTAPIIDMGAYEFQNISSSCLFLTVSNLVAGATAEFEVIRGTPGEVVIIVWGTGGPPRIFEGVQGFCATFGFDVPPKKATRRIVDQGAFDDEGAFRANKRVPRNVQGVELKFQAAERNTCPDECVSNVVTDIVQ